MKIGIKCGNVVSYYRCTIAHKHFGQVAKREEKKWHGQTCDSSIHKAGTHNTNYMTHSENTHTHPLANDFLTFSCIVRERQRAQFIDVIPFFLIA